MTDRPRFLSGPARVLARLAMRAQHKLGKHGARDRAYALRSQHFRRVFSTFRINCVLDVGAHHGDFAAGLRRDGYRGHIISFEPVASNFSVLAQRTAADPLWQAQHMALGTRRGEADMRVFGGSTFHSLLDASDYGRERFRDWLAVEGTEVVRMERLDAVLDDLVAGISDPRIFLKIDTQGYDLEVVRGAGKALTRIQALQTELTTRSIYAQETNSAFQAMAELSQLGFRLSAIFPILYEPDGLSLVEFDCLMCRSDDGLNAAQ
jgi:FkbM family methyltransferase